VIQPISGYANIWAVEKNLSTI
jgi:hypothetical protein